MMSGVKLPTPWLMLSEITLPSWIDSSSFSRTEFMRASLSFCLARLPVSSSIASFFCIETSVSVSVSGCLSKIPSRVCDKALKLGLDKVFRTFQVFN